MNRKCILYLNILIVSLLFVSICLASEDTVDISFLLPDNGEFTNGTTGWAITVGRDFPDYILSTVYSYTAEGRIGLFCRHFSQLYEVNTTIVSKVVLENPINIDTIIRDQILIEVYVMGNPTTILS